MVAIRARNEFHHDRGTLIEEDIVEASNEAQKHMERCMEALPFFTRCPIHLVHDFDVNRHNEAFVLKCPRLTGDGPGFP